MCIPGKRPTAEDDDREASQPKRILPMSEAADFNIMALQKLQKALKRDPEADLSLMLPAQYRSRLASRKKAAGNASNEVTSEAGATHENNKINQSIYQPMIPTAPAIIIHPLSKTLSRILGVRDDNSADPIQLKSLLIHLLQEVETIWHSKSSADRFVAKCSQDIVVKSFLKPTDFTEYTTLQFFEVHMPQIPAPRPHGLIVSGDLAYLFMSLIPGTPLDNIWDGLQNAQKSSFSERLDKLFLQLRQTPHPEGTALGGVAGEGCKDTRRHTRLSTKPLYHSSEFWDFQYSGARSGSPLYLQFLRSLLPAPRAGKCVFTHGDIRMENIMVERGADDEYQLTGILDWEMSGFYPEDFESMKITNTLATNETSDWFLHLPSCISPVRFPLRWFSDRVLDNHVA